MSKIPSSVAPLLAVLVVGCIQDGVHQVSGTWEIYTVRCSAEMRVEGDEYFARCKPRPCSENFTSGPVSHVVVAMDPGKKLVGYAERACIQDLSQASGIFNPALVQPDSLDEGKGKAKSE